MGKYSSIWEKLKADKLVVLAVPTRLQKRVIKGVIHTKNWDRIFAYECSLRGYREDLKIKKESSRVTIWLHRSQTAKSLMKAIEITGAASATYETNVETEGG